MSCSLSENYSLKKKITKIKSRKRSNTVNKNLKLQINKMVRNKKSLRRRSRRKSIKKSRNRRE
jgi:hypothetical protein